MVKLVSRKLSFYIASWLTASDNALSVAEMVVQAMSKRPNVLDTKVQRPDDSFIDVSHRRVEGDDTVFLDILIYDPERGSSTVPLSDFTVQRDTSSVSAPDDHSFLQGSAVIMLQGDNLLMASDSVRLPTVETYLRDLLVIDFGEKNSRFTFTNVANKEVLEELQGNSVEAIGLDSTLSEDMYQENFLSTRTTSLMNRFKETAVALIKEDASLAEISDGDFSNINASLVLKRDGRKKYGLTQEEFDASARDLLQDREPGIFIVLKGGSKITHNEIRLSNTVKVPLLEERHNFKDLWTHMDEYMSSLRAAGYLA